MNTHYTLHQGEINLYYVTKICQLPWHSLSGKYQCHQNQRKHCQSKSVKKEKSVFGVQKTLPFLFFFVLRLTHQPVIQLETLTFISFLSFAQIFLKASQERILFCFLPLQEKQKELCQLRKRNRDKIKRAMCSDCKLCGWLK